MSNGGATSTSQSSRPSRGAAKLVRQDSKVDSRFCCNICLDAVYEPVVTQCGHLYCWRCLYRWLEQNRRNCPVCKAACSVGSVVPIYVREPSTSSSTNAKENAAEKQAVPGHSRDDLDHSETQQHGHGQTQNNRDVSDASLTTDGSAAEASSPSTGLRRRNGTGTPIEPVPSRPSAISPRPTPSSPSTPLQYRNNNNNNNSTWVTPLSPGGHRSSLSHGILLSLQQATAASSSTIPSLRHREGGGANQLTDMDAHPDATEYLSRLLLMLASFVVLCLLML